MREFRILWGQRVRRDRWQLLVWVLGIGALTLFAASAIEQTYGEESTGRRSSRWPSPPRPS